MEGDESQEVGEDVLQHRVLAAQLQEKLHRDNQHLATKEQQNELLKSKLSLIKSRSKAKRESLEKDGRLDNKGKDVADASSRPKEDNSVERNQLRSKCNKGKINVLREQLEQNRLRFERHGQQLTEDARSVEAVVEQLRHKLEDNDVTLQQLQAGQLHSITTPVNDQVAKPDDLSSQLAEKESLVNQLMNQTTDLQNTILELQENLKEKDCVIEARTRAITLLSEDMSKKWRANVDMLEETRQQMHAMQENFVSIEAGLNKEKEHLKQQLENKSRKLLQVEHTLKQTETARFDLATRNAELQEKIVEFQGHTKPEQGLEEAQLKIEELTQALGDANRLTVKLKAEHKAKVKVLNKQIDGFRKESGSSDEVARLQNTVSGLEAEKAIQAEQINSLQKTILELQNSNFVSEREAERLSIGDIEEVISDLKLKLGDREREIDVLKEKLSLAQVENDNQASLVSEMNLELAEAKDALKEWQVRFETIDLKLKDTQMRMENAPMPLPYDATQDQNQAILSTKSSMELQVLQHELREKELELKQTETKLSVLEANLLSRVEYLESSFHSKSKQLLELETIISASIERLESVHFVNVLTSNEDNEEVLMLKNMINEQKCQIEVLEETLQSYQKEFEEFEALKVNFSKVSHELILAEEMCNKLSSISSDGNCEYCKNRENIETKLLEVSGALELKQEECIRLETKVKSLEEKLKKVAVNLKVKTVANKDLEDRLSKFDKIIQSSEAQIEELSREKVQLFEKWQTEISEKKAHEDQTAADLAEKEQIIHNLKDDIQNKMSLIFELNVKTDTMETQIKDLDAALQEKSFLLQGKTESEDQLSYSVQIASLQAELTSLQSQLSKEIEEKLAAASKLESLTKSVKLKLAKEKKVRNEMQEKQAELEHLLSKKSEEVREICEKYEKDIASLHQEVASLRSQEQERMEIGKLAPTENANLSAKLSADALQAAEEFSPPPSLETFEVEIENLCSSLSENSFPEILLILEEEQRKTLDELQSRFEAIYSQVISRLHQIPDLQGERKLFTELQNLVIRVRNRICVLESKRKKFVSDFEDQTKKNLFDAHQGIQTQERILTELKGHLSQNEEERSRLQEELTLVSQEKCDVQNLLQEEFEKLSIIEREFAVSQQKIKELSDLLDCSECNLQRKEEIIESVTSKYQAKESSLMELQKDMQEKDQAFQNLLLQNENNISTISTLQSQVHEEELKTLKLQDDLLKVNSSLSALQAESQEKTALIDCLQFQVQELPQLQGQLHELNHQNLLLENKVKDSQETEKLLSKAQEERKEYHENLLRTQQQLEESLFKSADLEQKLQDVSKLTFDLEIQLQEKSWKVTELENLLSSKSQEYNDQCSLLRAERDHLQNSVFDLTEKLHKAQHLVIPKDINTNIDVTKIENDESLRRQLAEKSAEVESYQQRLIQLQMGMPDSVPAVSIFDTPNVSDELTTLRDKVEELQNALNQTLTNSNSVMESFNTPSSFETTEVSQLNSKIADLSRQVDVLHLEKQNWEFERKNFDENVLNLTEQLNLLTSKREKAETELLSLSDLKAKSEAMSSELVAAQNLASQFSDLQIKANEQTEEIKELQKQLADLQDGKVKREEKYKNIQEQLSKLQAVSKVAELATGDERPSIPQSLDTHVSTLQTSDSDFYDDRQKAQFVHGAMDESLMERNIFQLESELRGMVTSQIDMSANGKRNDDGDWDWSKKELQPSKNPGIKVKKGPPGSDESLMAELKAKLGQLEAERNTALLEVANLQNEIKKLNSRNNLEDTCVTTPDTSIAMDQNWTEDDSWGWGADNASIEEQHQQQKCKGGDEKILDVEKLKSKILSLESEKETLESEKLKLTEDVKASQLRAAKLTRKYKELKLKYDEIAEKKKSVEFDSLDQAIEEERVQQMQNLERELKDVQTDLVSVRSERDKLQKQVEVFTSANERFLESKERQDVEVEMWQKRSKDLSNQIQVLEGRIKELETMRSGQEGSIMLQTVESQTHSTSSDSLNSVAVGQLIKENHTWNANYETLMQEYQKLRAQHLSDSEQRVQLDTLVAHQKDIIDRLEHEKAYLQDVYDSLKMDLEEANAQITSRQEDAKLIASLMEKNVDLLQKLSESEEKLDETLTKLQTLSVDNEELQEQCASSMDQSRKELSESAKEISHLKDQIKLLKQNFDNSTEGYVSSQQSPQNPVLKWSSIVSEATSEQESVDVFEIIATNTPQNSLKDDCDRKSEILSIDTHLEAKQHLTEIIELQKAELELARRTIFELKSKLESPNASPSVASDVIEHSMPQDLQIQQYQSQIFKQQKEIENLQISLAVSDEARKKLEEDIVLKSTVVQNESSNTFMDPANDLIATSYQVNELSSSSPSKENSLTTVVPEATKHSEKGVQRELDLALYRLHQRDARCDELTLELTRLLKERDALQLRLSNSIRVNEEFRDKLNQLTPSNQNVFPQNQNEPTLVHSSGAGDVPVFELSVPANAQSPTINVASIEDKMGLERKLAEIYEVHYGRDKWLREDQEIRHQQQMQLLYSSQSEAAVSNIEQNVSVITPEDPSSEPSDSSSTEAQGSFLGWLWGRS